MTTDRNFCRGGPMWPPVQAPLVKGGRAAKRRGILSSERFVANGIPHPAAPGASLPLLSRCARQFPIPTVAARHLPLIRGVGPLTGRIGLSQGGQAFARPVIPRPRRGRGNPLALNGEYGLPRRTCGPPRNDEERAVFVGRDDPARPGLCACRVVRRHEITHHVGRGTTPPGRGKPFVGAAPCGRPVSPSVWPSASHLPRQREAFFAGAFS